MAIVFQVASAAAALLHVLFFALESLWWRQPAVRRAFGLTEEQAETTRLLAFNQGFYNLFLALGAAWGQLAPSLGQPVAGRAVSVFALGSMLGAALVLLRSKPSAWQGALAQGLPPLVALAALVAG